MTNNDSKIIWKDSYYFPTLVDILVSNILLGISGVLLIVFFYIKGFDAILSIIKGMVTTLFSLRGIVSSIFALLLLCLLMIILILTIWLGFIVLRTFSYLFLSKHLIIYEGGIFLGQEKTLFKRFDYLLNKPLEKISFIKRIIFFRATLDYFFFKITNPESIYLDYNNIKSISITKEKVFRSILRKWWSPADEVYYLNFYNN